MNSESKFAFENMQALFQGTYYSLPRTSNLNIQSTRLSLGFTLTIITQYVLVKYKVHLRDPEVFGTFDLTLGDLSLGLGLGIWT